MTLSLDFASLIHTPKKVALRLAIFVALSLILMFGVMRWSAKGAFGITSAPIPQVTFTTSLQLAYYNQDNDWDSTVVLNNNAKDERFISITLYGKDGQALNVPVFSIPANSIKRFKITDWALGGNHFREGNINVAFNGKPMEITGQVSVVNSHDRLEFESKPSMPMDYSSKRLNGIVTLPERQAKAYVALTNTSNNPIEVSLTSDAEHVHADRVNLSAHETKVEEIKMKNGNNSPLSALVTLTHNGAVSALITTAFAINKQTGFTSNLYFYDDAKTVSNRLAGAHFRFGDANPTEGFPAGTVFKAPLVLANLGSAPTTATVTVDYTKNGQAKLQSIGSFPVPSRGVKEIELQAALAALGVTGPVDNAGVDIRYTGTTGTLIGQLTSASTNGDYSFDVPMKDPLINSNRTSGSYPFRLDGNYNTILHMKNLTDKQVRAVVQIRYEGGAYHPDQMTLEPFQTVAVDIKKFQLQQTLDIRGGVLPTSVTSGKVVWSERDQATVIGRAETFNIGGGVAGNFSCPLCSCATHSDSGSFWTGYVSPFTGVSIVGDQGFPIRGYETLISCDDLEGFGPFWVSGGMANWSSSNANVASVTANGYVSCLTAGSTNIFMNYFTIIARDNNSPNCDPTYGMESGHSSVQVHRVQIFKDGQDVTNQTTPVIVGQKMNLDLIVDDISTTNAQWAYSWTIPGASSAEKTAIKLYEPTVALGKVTLLAQADLTSKNIMFYWVEGSFAGTEKIVNASVTIGGQVFSVSTKFSVKSPRPKANGEVKATALGVNAIGIYPASGLTYLSYGNDNATPSQYGLTATADFEVPSSFAGTFHWQQKISSTRKKLNNSGAQPWNICTGFGLDAGISNDVFENGATFQDAPGVAVSNGQLRQIVQDQFTTWYMFRPSGADSIYVPLRKFDWLWSADYARNPTNNQWTRTSASVSVSNPAVQNTTTYFEWTTKIPPPTCRNSSTQF
jgi:hypothetical protein